MCGTKKKDDLRSRFRSDTRGWRGIFHRRRFSIESFVLIRHRLARPSASWSSHFVRRSSVFVSAFSALLSNRAKVNKMNLDQRTTHLPTLNEPSKKPVEKKKLVLSRTRPDKELPRWPPNTRERQLQRRRHQRHRQKQQQQLNNNTNNVWPDWLLLFIHSRRVLPRILVLAPADDVDCWISCSSFFLFFSVRFGLLTFLMHSRHFFPCNLSQ